MGQVLHECATTTYAVRKAIQRSQASVAQLARTGFYKEVHVKSPEAHGVRAVITARAHLVEERVRIDNTIRSLCITFGIKVGPGPGKDFIANARASGTIAGLGEAVQGLLAVREILIEQVAWLDRLLKEIAQTSTACQILMTIPGVGVQTAAAFAAAVDDADRFKRSRAAGAYFGLVPRRHQSGDVDWVGRITKQGDNQVRKLLYECQSAFKIDPLSASNIDPLVGCLCTGLAGAAARIHALAAAPAGVRG